ncbi:hypothetical protein AQUCO_03400148v1 [Aquilegia coerulea]|uniref:Uncharacterized protein n=1 Tax=Aquilegia coerulea TaxID=218851 RepID=A0A2G5CXQ8_AQUCA|nr:hypothetical protein AQUCO_03400148v1 [Aquilegia coerulea]
MNLGFSTFDSCFCSSFFDIFNASLHLSVPRQAIQYASSEVLRTAQECVHAPALPCPLSISSPNQAPASVSRREHGLLPVQPSVFQHKKSNCSQPRSSDVSPVQICLQYFRQLIQKS